MSGAGERRLAVLARLAGPDGLVSTARLCEVCAEVVEVDGAGIMLMTGDVARGSVATTGPVAERIEDLQYTAGDGPCVDAHHQGRPVLEADLADPAVARWPGFSADALAAGVRAVFGFPLLAGGDGLGALNLYRLRPGPLTDDQHANALVMADVVVDTLLALQAQAPPGALSAELEHSANFRHVVAQAAGMLSVQLDVSVTQALIRLRAHAYTQSRLVDDVAADVVARTLRLDGPSGDTP